MENTRQKLNFISTLMRMLFRPRLSVCFILIVITFNCFSESTIPVATKGVLDARGWDFKNQRLSLTGEFAFYPQEIISRHNFNATEWTNFPSLWNFKETKGQGYASYSALIIKDSTINKFSSYLPQIYSSYSLFINGELVAQNGKVGKSKDEATPQWLPQTVEFDAQGDTIEFVLTISNYHHYKGGIKESIYLGSPELFYQLDRTTHVSVLTEFATLFMMGIAFLIVYLSHEKKKIIMYFSLLCFSWAIRSVFSNQYLAINYFPDFNWALMVKIEYITLYLTMIWAILFLSRLFSKEGNQIIKHLLVISNSLFTVFTAFAPPLLFTRWLNVYLVFAGILIVYGSIIVLRALINERVGAWWLTISILLGLIIFGYDFIAFEGIFNYNPIVFSTGYILIFFMMGLALLYYLNIIKSKPKGPSVLRYEDLYRNK